jgi:acyl carrier protein
MANRERIAASVFRAVDEVNRMLPPESRLDKSHTTHIFGKDGKLDSLGFVNLIVAVEENIMEEFGVVISLADEKARSQETSPFQTFQTLIEYISVLLDEKTTGELRD